MKQTRSSSSRRCPMVDDDVWIMNILFVDDDVAGLWQSLDLLVSSDHFFFIFFSLYVSLSFFCFFLFISFFIFLLTFSFFFLYLNFSLFF